MNPGTRYVGDGRGPVTRGGKKPITKQGAHGTLYRYRVAYKGTENDPGAPPFAMCVWAYDEEHALEKVTDPDQGWLATSAGRVYA